MESPTSQSADRRGQLPYTRVQSALLHGLESSMRSAILQARAVLGAKTVAPSGGACTKGIPVDLASPVTSALYRGLLRSAMIALSLLSVGCATSHHDLSLDEVLEHELGERRNETPRYRCTVGAHRGSSLEYTENTLQALLAAEAEDKYGFIEFDVQYSKDNRIVVFHDKRLLRVFQSLKAIGSTTFADLSTATDGEVCSYEEAMTVLRNKRLNIEIKSQGDDEEDARLADELIADLRARGRLKDVMISSISGDVLKYIHSRHPEMPTGKIYWLTGSTYLHVDAFTRGLYEDLNEAGADYLMLHVANLRNIHDLLEFKPRGKTIVFWDFDDRMYLVHKDRSDRLWGDSGLRECFKQFRYRMFSPPRKPPK